MNSQSTPPPPPHKSFYSNYLAFSLLLAAIFFYSCDPPSSSATKTYTTTISGKITTPAENPIAAKVWASTDTANKVTAGAKGNYSLTVKHSGTFTIDADYKKPIPRSSVNLYYKASKTVKTTNPTHDLDITLQYGYTTTISGTVLSNDATGIKSFPNATVIIEVEGIEKDKETDGPSYKIENVAHPGCLMIRANPPASSPFLSSMPVPIKTSDEIYPNKNLILRRANPSKKIEDCPSY